MTAAVAHRNEVAQRQPQRQGQDQRGQRGDVAVRPRPSSPRSRPRLEVIDHAALQRRVRRRRALVLAFVVLLAGLFAIAFVHAQLVESQRELDELNGRIDELETERARIDRAIDEASAPERIVEQATALGMVRAESPAFLLAVGTGDG